MLTFKSCSAHDAYSLSKLCNIVFTLKLAELMKQRDSSVTVGLGCSV
jgi:hypothetical protein